MCPLYKNYNKIQTSKSLNFHLLLYYEITVHPFHDILIVLKAFQSVLPAIFISCYNLLQDFLSLNFALVSIRNMREKDITQGKA